MYTVRKVKKCNVFELYRVLTILRKCGKDMHERYGLEHWHNPWFKDVVIIGLCALKNNIFLVKDSEQRDVSTFQTNVHGKILHLQKLATVPNYSGNGVGTFCMNAVETMAKQHDCNKVRFEVYDKSQHAINFYEHRNYKVVGVTETPNYKELVMEKEL